MGKLRENLDTVSRQAAGLLRVIQAIRGRLTEIDTDLMKKATMTTRSPGKSRRKCERGRQAFQNRDPGTTDHGVILGQGGSTPA